MTVKHFSIAFLVLWSGVCLGQQTSLSHYNEFSIKPDTCQSDDLFYYTTNSSKSFNGKIANQMVYMFFKCFNDSTIKGYYQYNKYNKYNKSIVIKGRFKKDSIFIYEFDRDSNKIALLKVKYLNDSLKGNWCNLKTGKEFKVRLVQMDRTGDVYAPNDVYENNIYLVFNHNTYVVPLSKYLNSSFNYEFDVLLKKVINNNVYFIIRFYNFPQYPKAKDKYGWPATDQFLMYGKYEINGKTDTIQMFEISSDINNIENHVNYGSTYEKFRDSLNIDVTYKGQMINNNIIVSLKKINEGIIFRRLKINTPRFIYDTLGIDLDDYYQLVIRYKLSDIYAHNNYSYRIDSIYENNHKSITKLSIFCNDLKEDYAASIDKGEVWYGDYKAIKIEDYNFDGYNDIYIFNHEESGANNYAQTIWLYDINSGKYKKDTFLSSLNIWKVDPDKKTIVSGWRTSACDSKSDTYQLINGKFIRIEEYSQSCSSDWSTTTIITRKLINNKWVETKETK